MSSKGTSGFSKKRLRTASQSKGNTNFEMETAELTRQAVVIPSSLDILTSDLRQEIYKVWEENLHGHLRNSVSSEHSDGEVQPGSSATHLTSSSKKSALDSLRTVPSYKVGTLEMYKRFPHAYDIFMLRHDCSAVHSYLVCEVLERIVNTESQEGEGYSQEQGTEMTDEVGCVSSFKTSTRYPKNHSRLLASPLKQPLAVRAVDFGCGTGRIGSMLVQHPALFSLFSYDKESAMLRRCLLNTVKSAAASGHYDEVHLLRTAHPADSGEHVVLAPEDIACKPCNGSISGGSGSRVLRLVSQPCDFETIQSGFLKLPHLPCHLVVCAWALSYLVRQQWKGERWHVAVDAVVKGFIQLLETTDSDAAVVIIETLGNGSDTPTRHSALGEHLEAKFGFERRWVRTDYSFETMAEAVHMCRFFFGGDRMKDQLETLDDDSGRGKVLLKECTGIWTLWKPRTSPQ